jgi:acyl-CoA thioesterase-1
MITRAVTLTALFLSTVTAAMSVEIHNKGIGGQNSTEGCARFSQDVVALKPAFVFIYFGLNDTLNEPKFLPLDVYIENLGWMIEKARATGAKPVLCTIHRVTEKELLKRHKKEAYGAEGPNGKIDRYNQALRALAKKLSVPVADFAGAANTAGLDKIVSADGVHLTPAGSRLLAKTFAATVAGQVSPESVIVCLGDSVTYGAGMQGAGTVTGETYPAALKDFLGDSGKN